METIRQRAGSLLNSRHNKAVYSAVVGASLDFLFQLLLDLGNPVSPELQSKSIILAMALVALLVPDKNTNGEKESSMKKSIKTKFPLILVFALGFGLSFVGCAKHVGQDNVPKYAAFIQGAMEVVAEKGLKILDKHAPEQVQPTVDDLNAVLGVIAQYEDGEASVTEISSSIATLLDRVNVRLSVIESSDTSGLVLDVITTGGQLASIFLEAVELDPEVGVYIGAVKSGITSGIFKFDQSKRSPVAFFVYPLPHLDPVTLAYNGGAR